MRDFFGQLLRLLSFGAVLYSVVVLAIVATTPDVRLRALLSSGLQIDAADDPMTGDRADRGTELLTRGVILRQTAPTEDGPRAGDLLVELGDRPTPTFLDFSSALYRPKGATLQAGAGLKPHYDPKRLGSETKIWLIEWKDQRHVRVRYRPRQTEQGAGAPGAFGPVRTVWLPLGPAAPGRLALAVAWLSIQGVVFALAWLAAWRRPRDDANRYFLLLSSCTLVAIVGGSHWWLLASRPLLAIPFLVAATMLPAVLTKFVLVFPRPPESGRRWKRWLVFTPAVGVAVVVLTLSGIAWLLNAGAADAAIGEAREAMQGDPAATAKPGLPSAAAATAATTSVATSAAATSGAVGLRDELAIEGIDWMLSALRRVLYVYAGVAVVYYACCLWLLRLSVRRARNPLERRHADWMFWTACVGAVPVGYTLFVGASDPTRLALGDAQLVLFAVSLLLGLGYAAGLFVLRRVLRDEVADLGVAYPLLSVLASLLLAMTVAIATITVLSGVAPGTGSPTLATITLTSAVLIAWWVRGRVQQSLDVRFAQQKFDLGLRASQPAESKEIDELARQTIAEGRQTLSLTNAAMLLRADDRPDDGDGQIGFRSIATIDRPAIETLPIPQSLVDEWERVSGGEPPPLVQLAPGGRAEVHAVLHATDSRAIQPIAVGGGVIGLLVLGAKVSGEGFSPDDAVYLAALAQSAGAGVQSCQTTARLHQLGDELRGRVEQIEQQQRTIRELESELAAIRRQEEWHERTADETAVEGIRGSSPIIREVLGTVRKVAPSEASVLIRGESGTGKELLARAIHAGSGRSDGPLVSLHCAALSPSLLESELFGHVKGAFTDAKSDKVGRFAQADGGTLFFDEVGDIPLPVQVKLLRVLQERRFEPVGATESQATDVRVIAATHQDLEQLIAAGQFREDLYYRLNVVTMTLPPLRDRPGDAVELAMHFLAELTAEQSDPVRLDAAAIAAIESYDWPGNVRQLRNVIERALVLSDGRRITCGDLPSEIDAAPVATVAGPTERASLEAALASSGGNKAAAARELGLARSTFFSKLKKHGLA